MTAHQLVEKYPLIFVNYQGNPGMVNWLDVPDAWLPVIDDMCGAIQEYIDTCAWWIEGKKHTPKQVTCTQMKEKWGGLRFYVSGADDRVEGMIDMAAHICRKMCQSCGTRENLGSTNDWVSICCEPCYDAGKAGTGEWKPKK